MIRSQVSVLAVASFVRLCAAQAAGWNLDDGQINSTMCSWTGARAAVIRDTVYLDGGDLIWLPGLKDGTYGAQISDGNPLGLVYKLNFSSPFNTSTNISDVFTTISKAAGGSGASNNLAPNYVDGGMFANDYEWATYGGLIQVTDAFQTQSGSKAAIYQQYPKGEKQFQPGYITVDLPDGMTRYITYGAAVSVPSENLGYYFGGLRSSIFGEILQSPGGNASRNAFTNSLTMIEADMSTQGQEKWNNLTLPTSVPGRASAEIVWVPVSERGILVAIGGAINPDYANINRTNKGNPSLSLESTRQSPKFLSTVSVYDIETSRWYEQETSTPPDGALARGCAVVASSQDGSSHNIYWYGGFNGIDSTTVFNDDVWVLSVPSFAWVKVKSGDTTHGRAGHKCVKPYPDQMFVIGGYQSLSGTETRCLDDGFVKVFNLSSAEWITQYDPTVWSQYTVPQAVVSVIGGSPTGAATQSSPTPSGFSNSNLTSIFSSKYDSTKIVDWFPYNPSPTTNGTASPSITAVVKSGSSTPSYLAPVLAVVLGLFFITLLILGFLLWRRRKYLKSNPTASQSEAGTMDNRHWVTNWLRTTPADNKALTVTTDETPMTPYEDVPYMPEVGGTQVHEMMDTSRPVELHDTGMVGFTPISGSQRKSNGLAASASVTSHTSQASTVSRDSQSPRPGVSPMHTPRPDSPPLGGDNRFLSGVSNVSETDRGHLRGISETSVSTDGNYATPMERGEGLALQNMPPRAPPEGRPNVVSPLTPPSAISDGDGSDYLGAGRSPGSTRRRSNFEENLDEARK